MTYTLDYKRLIAARKAVGRSKSDMARLLGTTYVSYNGWEAGRVTPQPKFRGKIHTLFAVVDAKRKERDAWLNGNKAQRQEVIEDLIALRRPKGCLYPALIHRYLVKVLSEQHGPDKGFSMASDFAGQLLNQVAD
jgi:transcriptional regulator with XRE-family HTH domain